MKIIILLTVVALFGTSCERENVKAPESGVQIGPGNLRSYDFDGHKFIIYNGYKNGGLIHHPGCPCKPSNP